jgi:hypothetical protein
MENTPPPNYQFNCRTCQRTIKVFWDEKSSTELFVRFCPDTADGHHAPHVQRFFAYECDPLPDREAK